MQAEWEIILNAEAKAADGMHVVPLDFTHFLKTAFVRLHFLANELDIKTGKGNDDADAVFLAHTACKHFNDTIVIENTHQKVKDLLEEARHEQVARMAKFQAVVNSGVLQGREVSHLKVSNHLKAAAAVDKQRGALKFSKATHPNSHAMKKQFQNVMKYKASMPGFTWPSSSHNSLFGEAAALEFLVEKGMILVKDELEAATMTCLAGRPGDIMAHRDGLLLMVVAKSNVNFLAWHSEVVGEDDAGLAQIQLCQGGASSLAWHSIDDLQSWMVVPSKPMLKNQFGPLVLQQTSETLDLPHARIASGFDLTLKQCKLVLEHYGQKPEGKTKKILYQQIFKLFLDSAEEQEEALKKSSWNAKETVEDEAGEEDLSDYEDLLQHAEETSNIGDPDLKQEKRKVKQKREKMAVKEAVEVIKKEKAERKARRGRGRGRGGRKGRSRGRGGLEKMKHFQDVAIEGLQDLGTEKSGDLGSEVPMPSSSSGAKEAIVPGESSMRDEDEKLEETEKNPKKSTPAPKYHESPHHLLNQLAPPGAKLTLSTMDWRWCVTWKKGSYSAWSCPPWSQKTYTKRFTEENWQQQLEDVHSFAWQKWGLAKDMKDMQLKKDEKAQTPGDITSTNIEELESWVQHLPPAKVYKKLKVWPS